MNLSPCTECDETQGDFIDIDTVVHIVYREDFEDVGAAEEADEHVARDGRHLQPLEQNVLSVATGHSCHQDEQQPRPVI